MTGISPGPKPCRPPIRTMTAFLVDNHYALLTVLDREAALEKEA
jgi:hypothetical protein